MCFRKPKHIHAYKARKSNVSLNFVAFFIVTFHFQRFSQSCYTHGEQSKTAPNRTTLSKPYFRNFHLCRFVGGNIELLPECRTVHFTWNRNERPRWARHVMSWLCCRMEEEHQQEDCIWMTFLPFHFIYNSVFLFSGMLKLYVAGIRPSK